jgi:hypothetical protein
VLGLENLRGHAKADIAGLLDTPIDINVAVGDDEEDEIGRAVVARISSVKVMEAIPRADMYLPVTGLIPHLLDY